MASDDSWFDVPLPRRRVEERAALGSRARILSALERRGRALDRLRARADPDSLREYVWALFSAWAKAGRPADRLWVLDALFEVMDEELAERLAARIECDPKGARDELGLLRRHGSDAALAALSSLCRRLRAGPRHHARRALELAAKERTVDIEELRDGLVIAEARAELDVERARLERALSSGREWSFESWRQLRDHRVVGGLFRGLVWGQCGADGGLTSTFRVCAGGEALDAHDAPVELDPGLGLRLVHPLDLDPVERGAWGECLAEHELIAPFAQLVRPTRLGDPEDMEGDTLRQFVCSDEAQDVLLEALADLGWTIGEPGERLRARYFVRRLGSLCATLVVEPGLELERPGSAPQSVVEAFFAHRAPGGLSVVTGPRVPLREVPAAAISEVLHDLAALIG